MIIHQGAISSTTETNINKIHSWNVDYSLLLFEHAIQYGIPVKYASSASVYGNQQGIFNPLNYYAISKLQVDYWVIDNLDKFSSIQGFRYFNVYGDGEEDKGDQASPVSKFTKQIKETGKLKLFEGSDNFLRDFICVNDVVKIVLCNNKPSGVYDLGTSKPVSFQYVAECVSEKYNGEIEYVPFPDHLKGKYQDYTCAKNEWDDYEFISIRDYLK
jgi:ADP-L-glycero-D-manno-heptose 6-epimerase